MNGTALWNVHIRTTNSRIALDTDSYRSPSRQQKSGSNECAGYYNIICTAASTTGFPCSDRHLFVKETKENTEQQLLLAFQAPRIKLERFNLPWMPVWWDILPASLTSAGGCWKHPNKEEKSWTTVIWPAPWCGVITSYLPNHVTYTAQSVLLS